VLASPARAAATLVTTPASGTFSLTWLLVALPLAGAAVLLLGGKRLDKVGHLIGTAVAAVSFVLALVLFFALKSKTGAGRSVDDHLFSWVPVNGFHVDAALLLDQLSMVFCLLITGVGTLIHIYSIGYMEHDPGRRRFFAYLNLFVAAMLLLVLGDSYLLLYVGWEGVGLASYLLIAFWFYKPAAATAAKKAFIANRVGDVGLSLAIMLMFATLGTTSYAGVFAGAHNLNHAAATGIGLMLLLGACGKSGQFPLQTWLPDAMEGPTPVSALIHAATMVTAGVYLICRSNAIFEVSHAARVLVLLVGAVTLIYGCICGCAKDDIKKVLAYSTVSQIGYMFLAAGLGPAGYAIAILHLVAHGFFKANMFLGAGSVMHGMNDEVDMRRFGGLRTKMPVTFVTFTAGYLAIIGFPFFSGYFTKDKIIEAAFDYGNGSTAGILLGSAALLGAGITAFYMSRLWFMTFFGEKRWAQDAHPHESPNVMTIPMVILALGSVAGGGLLVLGKALQNWLAPVVGQAPEVPHTIAPAALTTLTLVIIALGVGTAYLIFGRSAVPAVAPEGNFLTVAARKGLYADAFNESVLMRPGQLLTAAFVYLDNRGIDGAVNGIAAGIGGGSGRLRRTQTGFVRSYALSFVGGTAVVLAALLVVRLG
jgi:NADH-quinone oxidoreductase subunit L